MKKLMQLLFLSALSVCLFAAGGKDMGNAAGVKYTSKGTYPIVSEPITVNIMVAQPPCVENYNTNEFSKFMEAKTGVKVNWIMVPEQAAKEKLALTLASGDYPDAFLGFALSFEQETTYGAEEKLLMPLNKYYKDGTLPNLTKALEDFSGAMGFMTITDGNIYSLPRLEVCYHCTNAAKMFVYKPFLDKLGLKVPQTTEEFYNTLVAIRDKDPNGNGKKDEIPLAGSIIGWNDQVERFLINSFIYCDLDTNTNASYEANVGYMLNGKKIDTAVNKAAYREALKYINRLYKEGLIYNGSFTQDSSQLTQLVESAAQPVVGFAAGGWRGQFSSLSGERFLHFQAIAPLKGPQGVREAVNFLSEPQTGILVLSAKTPYAEAILRYFDYMYSTEGTLKQKYGNEGDAWAWASASDVGLDGKKALWKQLKPWNDKDPQNVTFIQGYTIAETSAFRLGQAADVTGDYYAPKNLEKVLYDETYNLYKPYANVKKEVPSLKYTGEEIEKFSTIKQELANYIRQSAVKFMVGTLDVNSDKDWDTYLKNLDKLQLNAVLANMQKAYDRQYK
ncbi:ABC transporter substrate-binding protein [Treponema lecithinolyticum]|uniref:ABC transporter substrate-binding protein n=1 Tax=Treponema lecithinolyticum TaxID=53418 RepID=UPI0028E498C2|nr:ABC transporter substrate-binding protein [Treponema lecithinolyticum]